MLDGKQQKQALVREGLAGRSRTSASAARTASSKACRSPSLSSDQKEHLQKVLAMLVEPYRQSDRDEVTQCLKAQGGLDACHLAFYAQKRHRQRRRVGHLAARRPVVRLVLPRRAARPRVGQRGRRSEREAQRVGRLDLDRDRSLTSGFPASIEDRVFRSDVRGPQLAVAASPARKSERTFGSTPIAAASSPMERP